ncbi:hypothetical protein V8F33_003426 [Rhypophila sp. PSN 637]
MKGLIHQCGKVGPDNTCQLKNRHLGKVQQSVYIVLDISQVIREHQGLTHRWRGKVLSGALISSVQNKRQNIGPSSYLSLLANFVALVPRTKKGRHGSFNFWRRFKLILRTTEFPCRTTKSFQDAGSATVPVVTKACRYGLVLGLFFPPLTKNLPRQYPKQSTYQISTTNQPQCHSFDRLQGLSQLVLHKNDLSRFAPLVLCSRSDSR